MANNQHNSNSPGVWQKLYNATLSCISPRPKNSIPAPPPTAPHVNAPAAARQQLPNSGEVIPIEFDPKLSLTLQKPKEKIAKSQEDSFKLKTQDSMNDKFSNYISRVKNRMIRGSSNVRNAKILSRPDSFNDDVSNYIRRARGKMSASSTNVAGGNSVSVSSE